jgi:hypothetical protein
MRADRLLSLLMFLQNRAKRRRIAWPRNSRSPAARSSPICMRYASPGSRSTPSAGRMAGPISTRISG